MGLMLIGGSFYELMSGFRFSSGYRVEMAALLVRNLVFPCLVLAYVAWGPIPVGMEWMRQILVVQAAMPAGIFALVIVGSYSADRNIAMISILVTMVGSLVTLPIWLFVGVKLM
jgi:predicted permease